MALLFMATFSSSLLFGQQTGNDGENAIVLEYQDYQIFNDEPNYKIIEDNVNLLGYAYCDATNKLYVLDDRQNIIEYDLVNALSSGIKRTKTFRISFKVETQNNIMAVSPNGKWLAFVDEAGAYLHVMDVSSEQEVGSSKLGDKYHNVLYNNSSDFGHPFQFISDNEVLVSGSEKALLYNIERDREKSISFGRKFKGMTARWVTSNGVITGFGNIIDLPPRPFDMVAFFVENGKIKKTLEQIAVIEYPTFYRYYHHELSETIECYDKRTGEFLRIPFKYLDSDLNKYNITWDQNENHLTLRPSLFPFRNVTREEICQFDAVKPYNLRFRNIKTWGWLKDYQLLLVSRKDGKIQIFNHTLSNNEIEKQALRYYINTKKVENLSQYTSSNTRYTDFARQKMTEFINNEWRQLSNRSDLSYNHVQLIIDFIAKYDKLATVDEAKEELNWLYKEILERIPKDDVDQYKNYISQYNQSPYLALAREWLQNAVEIERQRIVAALENVDLTESLVAYYPFDGNANDYSPYRNHGNIRNATLTTGHNGQCFHFGGYDNRAAIVVPRSKSLTFSNAVSYSFWFKLDSYMGWGDAGTRADYGLMNIFNDYGAPLSAELKGNDNNSFHIILRRDKDVLETNIEGNPINQWYHAVFVETNTSSTIYINGKKVTSGNRNTSLSGSPGDLFIGHNRFHGLPFYGCIDEFMVFNKALTDIDVTALYNGKKPDAAKIQQIAKTIPSPSVEEDKVFAVNGEVFVMKYVKGGSKKLGNTHLTFSNLDNMSELEKIGFLFECPHEVTLSDFYMGEFPITENIWNAIMGSIPSADPGPTEGWQAAMPVENVSWYDCMEFINRLNAITGENFRLPTEAEWEYAAREGQSGPGYDYSGTNGDIEGAYSHHTANRVKLSVGVSVGPNKLGIWCMSGWVYEWCSDYFDLAYYGTLFEMERKGKKVINPVGPSQRETRSIRGGSFLSEKEDWKVYSRDSEYPSNKRRDLGLRLVLPAKK